MTDTDKLKVAREALERIAGIAKSEITYQPSGYTEIEGIAKSALSSLSSSEAQGECPSCACKDDETVCAKCGRVYNSVGHWSDCLKGQNCPLCGKAHSTKMYPKPTPEQGERCPKCPKCDDEGWIGSDLDGDPCDCEAGARLCETGDPAPPEPRQGEEWAGWKCDKCGFCKVHKNIDLESAYCECGTGKGTWRYFKDLSPYCAPSPQVGGKCLTCGRTQNDKRHSSTNYRAYEPHPFVPSPEPIGEVQPNINRIKE